MKKFSDILTEKGSKTVKVKTKNSVITLELSSFFRKDEADKISNAVNKSLTLLLKKIEKDTGVLITDTKLIINK